MAKTVFATGATVDSLSGKVLEVTYATVERLERVGFNGVEIVNRAGVKMCLDLDAAKQLAFVLESVLRGA